MIGVGAGYLVLLIVEQILTNSGHSHSHGTRHRTHTAHAPHTPHTHQGHPLTLRLDWIGPPGTPLQINDLDVRRELEETHVRVCRHI